MSGPWEKYQSQDNKKSGPWEKYKAQEQDDGEPSEKTSTGMSAFEHLGNGLSAGYLPQLQAMAEPLTNAIGNLVTGSDVKTDDYVTRRDENIKRLRQEQEEHPIASLGGELGGGIISGIATAGLGGEAQAARAPTVLGRVANAGLQGAKAGAVYGAVRNPGDVEGELSPLQIGERLRNSAQDAAVGGAMGAGLQSLGEGASAAKNYYANKAEEKAFKAAGANLRDFKKANDRDMVNKVGRQLLDDKIVTPFSTPTQIAERTQAGLEAKGAQLENILQDLDKSSKNLPDGLKAGIDRKAIAEAVRKDLINPNTDIPGVAAKNQKVEALISQFENGGNDLLDVLKGEQLKRSVGKEINWNRLPGTDIPVDEQVQRSLYSNLRKGVEDSATGLETLVGGPTAQSFKNAKTGYGNLELANKMANERVSRDAARRAIGLTDTISGGAGATIGGMIGGAPGALVGGAIGTGVNKLGRTFGDSLMANGFDKASQYSDILSKYAQAAGKVPSAVAQGAIRARGNEFFDKQQQRPEENPKLLEMISKNPELIEQFKDEGLKEALRKKIARDPSQAKPLRDAQDQFIKGNSN